MQSTLVIPTYKRPTGIVTALESVIAGTRLPDEILIIDDDELADEIIDDWSKQFLARGSILMYHKKDHSVHRRGLSESKNLALSLAQHEIIFYIDDDVVLDEGYMAVIMQLWETHADNVDLLGIGGRIANARQQSFIERLLYRFFGLSGETSWDVNPVGFQVWDQSVMETERAYYLHGGVSSYRRSVLKELQFTTFDGGRTGLEDVDLSIRAKQAGYYCLYVPKAFLYHYHEASGRESAFQSGIKEGVNRKKIFEHIGPHTVVHYPWFVWANVGWIIKKALGGHLRHAFGMIVGLLS